MRMPQFNGPKEPQTPVDIVRQKSLELDNEASLVEARDTKSKTAASRFKMVLGIFYFFLLFALYDRFFDWPPEWLVFGPLAVIFVLAALATGLTWKAMGPHGRNIIRMVLRHWFISLFIAINLIVVTGKWSKRLGCNPKAIDLKPKLAGPSSGRNWEILTDGENYRMLNLDEAKQACQQLGASWSLPQVEEFYQLKPRPSEHHRQDFWASDAVNNGKNIGYAARLSGSRGFSSITYRKPSRKQLPVLCIGSIRP